MADHSAPQMTLRAATGNANGSTNDFGTVQRVCSMVAVGTGTLVGTLTLQASHDGVSWVSTGVTVALTAAGTVAATASNFAFRYWRATLSGASGTGTVTARIITIP